MMRGEEGATGVKVYVVVPPSSLVCTVIVMWCGLSSEYDKRSQDNCTVVCIHTSQLQYMYVHVLGPFQFPPAGFEVELFHPSE